MARKLDFMDLKQILRLHKDGFSNRSIGQTLGISRNTINHYMTLFKACELSTDALLDLDSTSFSNLFPAKTTIDNERFHSLIKYFDKLKLSIKRTGFTFLYHYNEYTREVDNPYSYTQFMEHYHRRFAKHQGSMKLEHPAGRDMMIDFAGKTLSIVDRETGEIRKVEVFVAILPCSQYTYVEACMSQKKDDLIACIANGLSFYGGVPKAIVSDNLKSAVTRASKYEPEINRTLKDFAHHYNCVVNPTRAYAPKDKALVEQAVKLAYQRIYYPLREMTFFSLKELNDAIKVLLDDYNDYLFQRKQASRKELFQSIEKQELKPLPSTPYQIKGYRRAKVQKMGYVYFSEDSSYYSVPYRFIGKYTQIHFTKDYVEVHHNHERIATHRRNKIKGAYNTQEDHLSSKHRAYSEWSLDYFVNKAQKHGTHVTSFIKQLILKAKHPEIAYKRAMGVIQLHQKYGSERLNNACKRALYGDALSYKSVKSILEHNLDKETEISLEADRQIHIPFHENIRGAKNYY